MKTLYIIKTGKTFPTTKDKFGDFDDWVICFLGRNNAKIKIIDLIEDKKLPILGSSDGFIITGSHSMVTDEEKWSGSLEKYIRKINAKNIPLLGICYGHQLISKALGGKSNYNKKGKEIGRVRIKLRKNLNDDMLFKNFPKHFHAFESHYQSAVKLPRNSIILASNYKDRHQAVRFSSYTWGVQFHPEFDKHIMKEYILNQEDSLKKLGFNTNILIKNVNRCDISHKVINNFLNIIKEKDSALTK